MYLYYSCVVYCIFETCFISSYHLTDFFDLQNKICLYVCMYVSSQKKEFSSCFIFILGMFNPEAEGTMIL